MGNVSSYCSSEPKVQPIPTAVILKRIEECLLPDEKHTVCDYLEMIELKLLDDQQIKQTIEEIKEFKGIKLSIIVFRKMIQDDEMMKHIIPIYELLTTDVQTVIGLIQHDVIDLMNKMIKTHAKDEYIVSTAPKLLKQILAIGAAAAVSEINNEAVNLQLCISCQQAIIRAKMLNDDGDVDENALKLPSTNERMARVLNFMENYQDKENVQLAALNAMLTFSRNADVLNTVQETRMLPALGVALRDNIGSSPVITWRATLVLATLAMLSAEIAVDIAKLEIHEIMADQYKHFHDEPRVQQQLLWVFASLLSWKRSYRMIHESSVCIEFFKTLMETRNEQVAECAVSTKNKFKPYEVVVPLQIRKFLRETDGEVRKEDESKADESKKKNKQTKKRKNFDEHPKYGTVTEAFAKGEPGLTGPTKEEVKKMEKPPWEKHLQYGEGGKKIRGKNAKR